MYTPRANKAQTHVWFSTSREANIGPTQWGFIGSYEYNVNAMLYAVMLSYSGTAFVSSSRNATYGVFIRDGLIIKYATDNSYACVTLQEEANTVCTMAEMALEIQVNLINGSQLSFENMSNLIEWTKTNNGGEISEITFRMDDSTQRFKMQERRELLPYWGN